MNLLRRLFHAAFHPSQYSETDGRWLGVPNDVPSGEYIHEGNALSVPDWLKCVRVLSEDVAKTPLKIYERIQVAGSEGVQDAKNHGLFPILTEEPNDYMTAFTSKEVGMVHLLTNGNWYQYIERYQYTGKPAALWPIRPDMTEVKKGAGGNPEYHVRNESGAVEVFRYDEILHIPGLGYDGMRGYSLVKLMMEELGWSKATRRYGARYFGNGSIDRGFISAQGTLSDIARARIQKAVEKESGGSNRHKVQILEEGMTFQKMSIPNNEAQFLDTLKMQRTDLAGLMRVVLHKIGDYEHATFSNVEHLAIEHVGDGLLPWFERIRQEYNRKLLTAQEKKRFFIQFQVSALMRGDTDAQTKHCREMFNIGAYSPNLVLRFFGENPYEGGDERYIPLNMIPVSRLGEYYDQQAKPADASPATEAKPAQDPRAIAEGLVRNAVQKSYGPVFRDAIGRVLDRAAKDRAKALRSMSAILEGLADGLGLKADPEREEFLTDYLGAMAIRAKDWPADPDTVASEELSRAAAALIERCVP